MITLIGMGSGTPESLTAQGLAALQNAGLILGAKRLLEQLPQGCTEHRKALYQPEDVLAALAADPEVDAVLDEITRTTDAEARAELVVEAQKLIHEDSPFIYLAFTKNIIGAGSKVRGFNPVPTAMYDFRTVYFVE